MLSFEGPFGFQSRREGQRSEWRFAGDMPWHALYSGDIDHLKLVSDLGTGRRFELRVDEGEIVEVLDTPDRVMTCVWWNAPDEEMLIRDDESNQTYFIPPERVSSDIGESNQLYFIGVGEADTPVRVQWWEGRPLWVWGPA
jgi:hypothetical protein